MRDIVFELDAIGDGRARLAPKPLPRLPRVGDIVRDVDAPAHVGRVSAGLSAGRVQVRWGQTRWIREEIASRLEIVVRESTLFARLASQRGN